MSQFLPWRLLLSYLSITTIIFWTSAAEAYVFFHRSLDRHLQRQLLTLAQAAASSFEVVKTRGSQGLDRNFQRSLEQHHQSLEWFDADSKLLAKKGTLFPNFSFKPNFSTLHLNEISPAMLKEGEVCSVTIPVYVNDPGQRTPRLEGYIRASESHQQVEVVLSQLQQKLKLGGFIAVVLSSISGLGLNYFILEPSKQTFRQRLKQLAATASHELRNPIMAIATSVGVMLSYTDRANSKKVEQLTKIDDATDRLTSLLEDVLFLVRSEANASPALESFSIPLDELLEELAERFEFQAESQGVTIETHLIAGILINGDPRQLTRLFFNLLEKVLENTAAGGTVALSLHRCEQFAIVCVQDAGISIGESSCQQNEVELHLLERLGLGIAIAQVIALQHKGKITIGNQEEVGRYFQVCLPLG